MICPGSLMHPWTWDTFMKQISLPRNSPNPETSSVFVKVNKEFLVNANQRVSSMAAEITYTSLSGLVTVKCRGGVKVCYDKPNGMFLLSPPIPTGVCEQLHNLFIKLRNVIRRMSKESMLKNPWVIISLRDSGVKGFFPLNLREKVQDSRPEVHATSVFMRALKMSEAESRILISKICQGDQQAFVILIGASLAQLKDL
ncbi:hypothetical protein BgiMline_016809 [Biomphalaria glabrata]|nr:hypothetical protein BgiMline_009590 [Biomphalaria glabrata]